MAFMSCGNGVGFEIFEFQDPAYQKARDFANEFNHGGFFHIAVTVADPGMLIEIKAESERYTDMLRWGCEESQRTGRKTNWRYM